MLTTGEPWRRALCRFASPFARPGPRYKNVHASLSAMRPYPVRGPGADAFEQPRASRISGTESNDATKCSSAISGFAKHTRRPRYRHCPGGPSSSSLHMPPLLDLELRGIRLESTDRRPTFAAGEHAIAGLDHALFGEPIVAPVRRMPGAVNVREV